MKDCTNPLNECIQLSIYPLLPSRRQRNNSIIITVVNIVIYRIHPMTMLLTLVSDVNTCAPCTDTGTTDTENVLRRGVAIRHKSEMTFSCPTVHRQATPHSHMKAERPNILFRPQTHLLHSLYDTTPKMIYKQYRATEREMAGFSIGARKITNRRDITSVIPTSQGVSQLVNRHYLQAVHFLEACAPRSPLQDWSPCQDTYFLHAKHSRESAPY